MPISTLSNAEIIFGGYNLSGFANAVALDASVNIHETPVFADEATRRVAGLKITGMNVEGYFDPTIDAGLFASRSVNDVPIVVAPQAVEGERAYLMRALTARIQLGGEVGAPNGYALEAMGSDGADLIRGNILIRGSKSSSGNGAGQNLGSVSGSQSLFASLHVFSASGSLDATIESDVDDNWSSPVTQITFAQATAIGSEYKMLAGPISDGWFRVAYTITGGPFDFFVFAGIQ